MNGGRRTRNASLAIASVGVVFGDIGTSPLYAIRQAFTERSATVATEADVLGVCSLIVWALVIIVSVKYVTFVMRADHDGEGGILSLFALVDRDRLGRRAAAFIGVIGIFGTALLYGDGIITPAISVLSAVEGFEVASSAIAPYVDYLAIAVLVVLFAAQHRGTSQIARVFAPIMVVWFVTIFLLGLRWILTAPSILRALLPTHGVRFLLGHGSTGLVTLGAVFLAVTGAEALYADLGHFGRGPITRGWYRLVLPSLLICYLGQGASLLDDPARISNPFFEMAPSAVVLPLAVLATAATIIASQSLISGVFSLTTQAIHLGYAPRLRVVHTSDRERGQVYVPALNWTLMALCVLLIIGFGSSARLADAYGVAVVSTMAITTALLYLVMRQRWLWSTLKALAVCLPLLLVDLVFVAANIPKIPTGGWLPLGVAAIVFTLLMTWRSGQKRTAAAKHDAPIETLRTEPDPAALTDGAGIYLHQDPTRVPHVFVANLSAKHSRPRASVFLNITTDEHAVVDAASRFDVSNLGAEQWQVTMRVGFMQRPDVPQLLRSLPSTITIDLDHATYFLSEDLIVPEAGRRKPRLRNRLFVAMSRASVDLAEYYRLPSDRVVVVTRPLNI